MSYEASSGDYGNPNSGKVDLYSLKWETFETDLSKSLRTLFLEGDDAYDLDVTLVAEGRHIRSHKWLLSLCSPYFKKLFKANKLSRDNTIVFLSNIKFKDLQNIILFIYNGEVKVSKHEMKGLLRAGVMLHIQGLAKFSKPAKDETDTEVIQGNVPVLERLHFSKNPSPPNVSMHNVEQQPSNSLRYSQENLNGMTGSEIKSSSLMKTNHNLIKTSSKQHAAVTIPAESPAKHQRYTTNATDTSSGISISASSRISMCSLTASPTYSCSSSGKDGLMGVSGNATPSFGGEGESGRVDEKIVRVGQLATNNVGNAFDLELLEQNVNKLGNSSSSMGQTIGQASLNSNTPGPASENVDTSSNGVSPTHKPLVLRLPKPPPSEKYKFPVVGARCDVGMGGKKASAIWMFFSRFEDAATCNFCEIKYAKGFSTSALRRHLKNKHGGYFK